MNLRLLRWLAVLLPLAFLGLVDYLRHFTSPLAYYLHTWPGYILFGSIVLAGTLVFSQVVFGVVERAQRQLVAQNRTLEALTASARRKSEQLRALHEADIALTSELSSEAVLGKVVELSRHLAGARYGALAVLDEEGEIGPFFASGLSPEERARIGAPPKGYGVVGVVLREGRPLRMADISQHPAAVGFPPHHPPMRSFLGVPIISRGKVMGSLYLAEEQGAAGFSQEDEDALTMFAAQAAVAIENARLYERVQALAVLEERERIAQDLHDGIIQSLYAIGLNLERCLSRLRQRPEEVSFRLAEAIEGLNGVIGDIRNYIFRLEKYQGPDLRQGLSDLAREFQVNSLLETSTAFEGEVDGVLSAEQAGHLLHIAREALTNVLKHAQATAVALTLSHSQERLTLTIADNGVGFDPASAPSAAGYGLRHMAERASSLGGALTMESALGRGTKITVKLPLPGAGHGG